MRPVPKVVLPTGFGINCEAETAHAFGLVGANVTLIHTNDLMDDPSVMARAQVLALAGGFSFGDHLGAGRVLANRLSCRLGKYLAKFVADGGLVLGICNGFQTMIRLGLLSADNSGIQKVSLATNQHGAFYDGWVSLGVDPVSPCVFTRGLDYLELPVRHGEGRFIAANGILKKVQQDHLAPI
ncbi:MAG: phosphoribosylformylglycinamidine synthase subunit PurQ, partial [Pseudomonadota bacterium]